MKFLFVIALLLLVITMYQRVCNKLDVLVFSGASPGPTVLLVGGTHGNEPAGAHALSRLASELQSGLLSAKAGKIIIVPQANKCGLSLGTRFQPQNILTLGLSGSLDLNRSYSEASPGCELASSIGGLASEADWVLDLHEGWGFHKIENDSMGSGVYFGKSEQARQVAQQITSALNQLIQPEIKQFVCQEWKDTPGTLRSLADKTNTNYILIETSGQNDIQPLQVRSDQHLFLSRQLLSRLGLV
jgi:predicted deacylase